MIKQACWPETIVEEANLTNNVWALRKTLGDGQNDHRYIETVPKRGYRFIADVTELPDAQSEMVVEKHTFKRVINEEDNKGVTWKRGDAATAQDILTLPACSAASRHTRLPAPLKLLVACVLVIGLALHIYRSWSTRETRKTAVGAAANHAQLKSITVLPFKVIGESDNEYLGLGMSDALIARLGHLRQLVVRPASAVRRYADTDYDPVAAGREQGVDVVLDGSVQREGSRIRVNVQLVRLEDWAILWSGQFDECLTDIFAVQDSISERVMNALTLTLSGEECPTG